MESSLLIATCLIVAIRTAKWAARSDAALSGQELNGEIELAAHIAGRAMTALISKYEAIYSQRKEPWYQANDEDVQK